MTLRARRVGSFQATFYKGDNFCYLLYGLVKNIERCLK